MIFGIRLEGWLTIVAIILGPLLAFAVQNWRDERRERRNRKTEIFRRLLLTLKVPMAPSHVDAINSIPLEFSSEKKVLDAWKLYSSHLNVPQQPQQTSEQVARWAEKKFDLLIDLVYEIGQNLGGYDHLNKASLRDSIYVPKGYAESEEEMRQIRAQWLQVLKGERVLPVTMLGPVQIEKPLELLPEISPADQALPEQEGTAEGSTRGPV
ncbi:MAG TPA: DUF6680 family protein [Terriglobales bacterium]|nr:DUF6680 family protein [Terriglobales bacterium]